MKSFLTFISEAPISDEGTEVYSQTPRNKDGSFNAKFSPEHFAAVFASDFKMVGNGSSRIAFRCDVPVKLFADTHKEQLGMSKDGITCTVLKVASSAKGVQQNTAELQLWDELKYDEYAQYLCPVLDWSGNPKYSNNSQYVLDINNYNIDINFEGDLKGAVWIQMPFCVPAMKYRKEFMKLFLDKFGPIDFDYVAEVDDEVMKKFYPQPDECKQAIELMKDYKADQSSLENLHCLIFSKKFPFNHKRVTGIREKMLDEGTLTWEQFDALYGLIDMCVHHGIADIAHWSNWGIHNKQPVIIDYGYDKKSETIYHSRDKVDFNVYVDKSGAVRIKYKEKDNAKDNDSKGNT